VGVLYNYEYLISIASTLILLMILNKFMCDKTLVRMKEHGKNMIRYQIKNSKNVSMYILKCKKLCKSWTVCDVLRTFEVSFVRKGNLD